MSINLYREELKAMARALDVPVLAVYQLNRAVKWRASHKP